MARRISIALVAILVILGIATDSGALPLRARGTLVGTPCTIEVKEARFTQEAARYTFAGTCPIHHDGTVPVYIVRWTGQGAVAYTRGFPTQESIVILPPAAGEPAPPYRVQGKIKAQWNCFGDKWLEAEGNCGPVTQRALAAGADIASALHDHARGDYRAYEALDIEGHRWRFVQWMREVPRST